MRYERGYQPANIRRCQFWKKWVVRSAFCNMLDHCLVTVGLCALEGSFRRGFVQ